MSEPRVAVVCSGIGVVSRGFERTMRDLFDTVGDSADLTLFKGAGPATSREVPLRALRRTSPLLAPVGPDRAVAIELATFALRLWPQLAAGRFDVIHCIEPYLLNVLAALGRRFGPRGTLLHTDGLGLTAASLRRADALHVLTPIALETVVGEGRSAATVRTLPTGIDVAGFSPTASRAEARQQLGLPAEQRILLEVAALNRRHKRVDALIEEVALLPGEPLLVVAGAPEEPEVATLGRARLGDRFRNVYVAPGEMPLWYAAADVLVHGALVEGYCLAILEAMAAGLPVIAHASPHFEWLVGDRRQLVDLEQRGAVGRALAALPGDASARNRERVAELDWPNLVPGYLDLYAWAHETGGALQGRSAMADK